MLLAAAERGETPLAAEIAALLEERDSFRSFDGADLGERIRRMRRRPGEFRNQLVIKKQLLGLMKAPDRELDPDRAGVLTAFAFPDWIGRARSRHSRSYLLSGGAGASLPENDVLCRSEFLAVARLTGSAGRDSRIELAAPLDRAELEAAFADRLAEHTVVEFDPERERAAPAEPPPGAIPAAVLNAALERGIELPPSDQKGAAALLKKVRFAARQEPDRYPDWSPESWQTVLPGLALPFLGAVRSFAELRKADWHTILQNALGYDLLRELNQEYPDFFTTPVGASHRIDYDREQPTLPVRVQELYGVKTHPTVGRSKFPLRLELLSPAHRPVQVTTDLPGFWAGSWKLVQKEMKGRYPKHFWPDDPADAAPTTRTKAKM